MWFQISYFKREQYFFLSFLNTTQTWLKNFFNNTKMVQCKDTHFSCPLVLFPRANPFLMCFLTESVDTSYFFFTITQKGAFFILFYPLFFKLNPSWNSIPAHTQVPLHPTLTYLTDSYWLSSMTTNNVAIVFSYKNHFPLVNVPVR